MKFTEKLRHAIKMVTFASLLVGATSPLLGYILEQSTQSMSLAALFVMACMSTYHLIRSYAAEKTAAMKSFLYAGAAAGFFVFALLLPGKISGAWFPAAILLVLISATCYRVINKDLLNEYRNFLKLEMTFLFISLIMLCIWSVIVFWFGNAMWLVIKPTFEMIISKILL